MFAKGTSVIALLLATAAPALAQTAPERVSPPDAQEATAEDPQASLGDIIGSANRRAQNLQEVPVAVSRSQAMR